MCAVNTDLKPIDLYSLVLSTDVPVKFVVCCFTQAAQQVLMNEKTKNIKWEAEEVLSYQSYF